jgi:hypothetical protein
MFLGWGPVGVGKGPMSVAYVASTGTVPQKRPSMILIPIQTPKSAAAVIDRVGIRGGGGYPPPLLLAVIGDQDHNCSGIWWPLTGHNGFLQRCAHGGTEPLLGHTIPLPRADLTAPAGQAPGMRATEVAIEVAPPGTAGCWGVARVTVHYHVGGRHYTAVASESLTGCTLDAEQLSPGGPAPLPEPTPTPSAYPARPGPVHTGTRASAAPANR